MSASPDEGLNVEAASLGGSGQRLFVTPTTEQITDPTRCIFCAKTLTGRRSREHIFPRWLLGHYEAASAPFHVTWMSDPDDEVREQREFSMGNLVAGRVCTCCNNGWMSQLEQAVSAVLLPLASTERRLRFLTAEERRLIVRWAVKTAFAARSADPGPSLVDPQQASALVDGGLPPVHVVGRQSPVDMGLSWFSTQRWLVSYPESAFDDATELVGTSHKTVLTVGRLLLAVCFWPDPNWSVVVSRQSHTPLWPLAENWLTYPQATDSHGIDPTRETELIDMTVGTRIAHPESQSDFTPVDPLHL
ncbi:MAG TPA: hypothetical protein VF081_02800 [Solirubrobacterales bacterium]